MRQAFYPLTLRLTVDPGSIAVAITVGANRTEGAEWRWPLIAGLLIGALVIAVSIYLLRFAEYSDKPCGAGFSLRGTSVPLERLAGTCGRRAEATPQAEARLKPAPHGLSLYSASLINYRHRAGRASGPPFKFSEKAGSKDRPGARDINCRPVPYNYGHESGR